MTVFPRLGSLLLAVASVVAVAAAPREAPTAVFAAERQLPPKPTGPIAVDCQLASSPVVGQALEIVITARSAAAAGLVLDASVSEPAARLL